MTLWLRSLVPCLPRCWVPGNGLWSLDWIFLLRGIVFFSIWLDWLCDDFVVEIPGSVSPSLMENGLVALSTVSVVLFFSTLLHWFCAGFVEIPGPVSLSTLCNGLGLFSIVSVVFVSHLLGWFCADFVEIPVPRLPGRWVPGNWLCSVCRQLCFSQLC